jgi:hypothetical protein
MLINPNELLIKVANLKINFTPLAIKTLPFFDGNWTIFESSLMHFSNTCPKNPISNLTNSFFPN